MRAERYIIFTILVASFLLAPQQLPAVVVPSEEIQSSASMLSQTYDLQRIGTMETIVTEIDSSGTVRNAIATFQNASYYETDYTSDYQAIAESQMLSANGFVAGAQLEIANRTVLPNGRYGGPGASLTLLINPIIVLPMIASEMYLLTPGISEVISLGNALVAQYETDLGLEFHRLAITKQYIAAYLYIDGASLYNLTWQYQVEYISMIPENETIGPMTNLRNRLANLGGFMELLNGEDWPLNRTTLAESMIFDHHSGTYYYGGMMNPYYMQASLYRPYIRAHPIHSYYSETVSTGVVGMAGFDDVEYISNGPGNETYSLKQHVGYSGEIESKMYQDMTVNSMSAIFAATPSVLGGEGVPDEWEYVTKDFTFNTTGPIMWTPDGEYIYGTDPIEKFIEAYINWYPRYYGMNVYQSISYTSPTYFDNIIDSLWGGMGPYPPYPDYREMYLEGDYSYMFSNYPLVELNQDLLRELLEGVGVNPQSLLDNINDTLFDESPAQAIFEAFLGLFDNYHLLDILRSTSYSNPVILENMMDDFFGNVSQFLMDFAGIDLPSSYETKDAFTALIEDHFGLMLQAVWDSMSSYIGTTNQIKTAVHAIMDPEHLIDETVPYFWTDLYSSVVEEYDYGMWINLDMPVFTGTYEPYNPPLLWMQTDDIVLEFEMDIESITYSGPHLTVTKDLISHQIEVDTTSTVNITVKNIGNTPAYDIKILDGVTDGFVTDKQYYWNKGYMAPGEIWRVSVNLTAQEIGQFIEVPTIVCYFNQSLTSFTTSNPLLWNGAAMYTFSTIGREMLVYNLTSPEPPWWELDPSTLQMTIIVIGGVGGAILIIVLIIKLRKPGSSYDFTYG